MSAALTLGLAPTVRFPLAEGDLGTAQTIDKIRKLVHQGMTDQFVNRTAIAIVRAAGIQQFDFSGEIRALYEWARRNLRFTRDIAGIETLRTAREVLITRAGDCDDINAILLPALLGTIGHHVRLVTIAADPGAPRAFSHIYCEVEAVAPNGRGQWVPLDAARRNASFGLSPRHYFRKRLWSLTDRGYHDVQGLSGYFTQAPRIRGRLTRGGRGRLGDWTDSLDSISQLINAGTTGAANIISATQPRFPSYLPPASGLNPAGAIYAQTVPGGVSAAGAGSIPNWMLYGGMALAALLVLKR